MEKPDCKNILDQIPLYIDNMLSEEETDIVCKHIKTCSACKKEYEFIKSISKASAGLVSPALSKDFHDRLMQKISAEAAPKRRIALPWRKAMHFAAAAAVIALSVVSFLNLEQKAPSANVDEYLPAASETPSGEVQTAQPEQTTEQGESVAQITDHAKATPKPQKTVKKPVNATAPAKKTTQESRMDEKTLPSENPPVTESEVISPASARIVQEPDSTAYSGENDETETATAYRVVTVTVSETAYDEAAHILSVCEMDENGYRAEEKLPDLLDALSALEDYEMTSRASSDVTADYIQLTK